MDQVRVQYTGQMSVKINFSTILTYTPISLNWPPHLKMFASFISPVQGKHISQRNTHNIAVFKSYDIVPSSGDFSILFIM
jgi:hypothetical protein